MTRHRPLRTHGQGLKSPDRWIGPLCSGEHVREMGLIKKAALGADLSQGQGRIRNQPFGLGNALMANPVLGRHSGTALERPRKVAA